MGLFEEHASEETLTAFELFVGYMPHQIVHQVLVDSGGDVEKGKDLFWKMFMNTSDYGKREWGWIKPVLDRIEISEFKKKKKVEDPMMNPFLSPMGGEGGGGGGCDCGSCGG